MTTIERELTHSPAEDPAAEQAVLGIVLNQPTLYQEAGLTGDEFYQPRHETIWQAMGFLVAQDHLPEPSAVLSRLIDSGDLARVGGGPYLHDLIATAANPLSLDFYVARIRDKHGKRLLADSAAAILRDVQSSTDPYEDVQRRAEALLTRSSTAFEDIESVQTLEEFLAQDIPPYDWIIPDLLDRGDRMILTGTEGLGKSVLMRQIGVCTAAGMDPFTGHRIPSQNVLLVDCENPLRIMLKVFDGIATAVRGHLGHEIPEGRMWIRRRPAGISLDKPADRLWLKRLCTTINPDLLCIGPTYKLYEGEGSHEEHAAQQVTSLLDEIREEVGCAVVMEHHSPHAAGGNTRTIRPIGSSYWLRWPEFGVGLRLVQGREDAERRRLVDVVHWRGARDERRWPENLESGGTTMPWVEVVL